MRFSACRSLYKESKADVVCNKTSTFAESKVFTSDGRVNDGSDFIRHSRYDTSMAVWLRWFSFADHIHIVDGLELKANPVSAVDKVQQFLGLPQLISTENVEFDKERGVYCIRWRTGEGRCLGEYARYKHPRLTANMLRTLREYFKPFNQRFYDMVGKDFGWS